MSLLFPYNHTNFLQSISKPLKFLGYELNIRRKSVEIPFKILLIYPDYYERMLNDPWFEILMQMLNENDEFLVDFVFMPEEQAREALLENKEKLVSSLYSLPFQQFKVHYFSIDHEGQIPECFYLQNLGGMTGEDIKTQPVVMYATGNGRNFPDLNVKLLKNRGPRCLNILLNNINKKFKNANGELPENSKFWNNIEEPESEKPGDENHSSEYSPVISWTDAAGIMDRISPGDFNQPVT
ncbi:MAG: hypothetical protein KAR38_14365 [Calditrichia bacterium]|nr:hypothetical protein [Calditrichia bacterium]